MAESVKITRQTIISIENGNYNASLILLHKITKFFELSIEEVFIFE
ncbi:putative regulator [Clostridium neonatale]|nr:Putative regulator [Clostridium neonatale]CAI3219095.1 putative regulator [Clostridium neonatale]CAI3243879.1 putative regulator [Clostridium neonatale]CAI3574534.1 putative regulator [Clostridium neonatale]